MAWDLGGDLGRIWEGIWVGFGRGSGPDLGGDRGRNWEGIGVGNGGDLGRNRDGIGVGFGRGSGSETEGIWVGFGRGSGSETEGILGVASDSLHVTSTEEHMLHLQNINMLHLQNKDMPYRKIGIKKSFVFGTGHHGAIMTPAGGQGGGPILIPVRG